MVIKQAISSIVIWLTVAGAVRAECSTADGWAMVETLLSAEWKLMKVEAFETTEGPGDRKIYMDDSGLTRLDEFGCASYYCLRTVEIKDDERQTSCIFTDGRAL